MDLPDVAERVFSGVREIKPGLVEPSLGKEKSGEVAINIRALGIDFEGSKVLVNF